MKRAAAKRVGALSVVRIGFIESALCSRTMSDSAVEAYRYINEKFGSNEEVP